MLHEDAAGSVPLTGIAIFIAGLVVGIALGAVLVLWTIKHLGIMPKPRKFALLAGIVGLPMCVGFFAVCFVATGELWIITFPLGERWPTVSTAAGVAVGVGTVAMGGLLR